MKNIRKFFLTVLGAALLVCASLFVVACKDKKKEFKVTTEYESEKGTVSLSPDSADGVYEENTSVTVTVTPKEDYAVDEFTVSTDADAALSDNKYTFKVTADTKIAVTFKEEGATDALFSDDYVGNWTLDEQTFAIAADKLTAKDGADTLDATVVKTESGYVVTLSGVGPGGQAFTQTLSIALTPDKMALAVAVKEDEDDPEEEAYVMYFWDETKLPAKVEYPALVGDWLSVSGEEGGFPSTDKVVVDADGAIVAFGQSGIGEGRLLTADAAAGTFTVRYGDEWAAGKYAAADDEIEIEAFGIVMTPYEAADFDPALVGTWLLGGGNEIAVEISAKTFAVKSGATALPVDVFSFREENGGGIAMDGEPDIGGETEPSYTTVVFVLWDGVCFSVDGRADDEDGYRMLSFSDTTNDGENKIGYYFVKQGIASIAVDSALDGTWADVMDSSFRPIRIGSGKIERDPGENFFVIADNGFDYGDGWVDYNYEFIVDGRDWCSISLSVSPDAEELSLTFSSYLTYDYKSLALYVEGTPFLEILGNEYVGAWENANYRFTIKSNGNVAIVDKAAAAEDPETEAQTGYTFVEESDDMIQYGIFWNGKKYYLGYDGTGAAPKLSVFNTTVDFSEDLVRAAIGLPEGLKGATFYEKYGNGKLVSDANGNATWGTNGFELLWLEESWGDFSGEVAITKDGETRIFGFGYYSYSPDEFSCNLDFGDDDANFTFVKTAETIDSDWIGVYKKGTATVEIAANKVTIGTEEFTVFAYSEGTLLLVKNDEVTYSIVQEGGISIGVTAIASEARASYVKDPPATVSVPAKFVGEWIGGVSSGETAATNEKFVISADGKIVWTGHTVVLYGIEDSEYMSFIEVVIDGEYTSLFVETVTVTDGEGEDASERVTGYEFTVTFFDDVAMETTDYKFTKAVTNA